MKKISLNKRALNIFSSLLVLLTVFIVFSCKTEINKDEVLKTASVPNMDFAKDLIKNNSNLGFAEADKGKKDSLVLIANALVKNDYAGVIKIGNEYISRYSMDNDVQYMMANALFQQGEYGKAAKHFISLSADKSFKEIRRTKYLLALCYIRFDKGAESTNALKLLEQLKADPGEDFRANEIQSLIDLVS